MIPSQGSDFSLPIQFDAYKNPDRAGFNHNLDNQPPQTKQTKIALWLVGIQNFVYVC